MSAQFSARLVNIPGAGLHYFETRELAEAWGRAAGFEVAIEPVPVDHFEARAFAMETIHSDGLVISEDAEVDPACDGSGYWIAAWAWVDASDVASAPARITCASCGGTGSEPEGARCSHCGGCGTLPEIAS